MIEALKVERDRLSAWIVAHASDQLVSAEKMRETLTLHRALSALVMRP